MPEGPSPHSATMLHLTQDCRSGALDSHEEGQCDSSDCVSEDDCKAVARSASSSPEFVDRTCFGCRLSKVKCDKFFPCGRCTRMGVTCVEQTPKLCAIHFSGPKKYPKKKRGVGIKKRKRAGHRAGSSSISTSSSSSNSSVSSASSTGSSKAGVTKERPVRLRSKASSSSGGGKKARCDDVEEDREEGGDRGREDGGYRVPFMSTAEQRRSRVLSRERSGSLSTLPAPGNEIKKVAATAPAPPKLEKMKQPTRTKDDDDNGSPASPHVGRTPGQIVLATFFELRALDRVDFTRACNVVKSWAMSSLRYSRKPLMASVKALSDALGMDLRQALDSPYLTALDPNTPPSIPEHRITPFLHEIYSNANPAVVQIMVHGESRFFCNPLWSESFFTEDFGNHAFTRSDTLLAYDVLGIAVSAEDREEFFQTCAATLFTSSGEMSEFSKVLKCHDVGGNDFLALVRLRVCVSQDGYYHGTALSIQALPESKYIDWNLDDDDGLMVEGGPLTLDDDEEDDDMMMAAAGGGGEEWLPASAQQQEVAAADVVGDWTGDPAAPLGLYSAIHTRPPAIFDELPGGAVTAAAPGPAVPQGQGVEPEPQLLETVKMEQQQQEGGGEDDGGLLLCREDVVSSSSTLHNNKW